MGGALVKAGATVRRAEPDKPRGCRGHREEEKRERGRQRSIGRSLHILLRIHCAVHSLYNMALKLKIEADEDEGVRFGDRKRERRERERKEGRQLSRQLRPCCCCCCFRDCCYCEGLSHRLASHPQKQQRSSKLTLRQKKFLASSLLLLMSIFLGFHFKAGIISQST